MRCDKYFFVFLFLLFGISFVSSVDYYVGEGLLYEDIQSAIDVAEDGDIIHVFAGEYFENLVIEKNLTIIGDSEDRPLITGRGIVKEDVIFDNVDFRHESLGYGATVRGVLALKASNKTLTIKNSNITQLGISDGILLGTSSGGDNYVGQGLNLDNVSLYANNGGTQGISVKESYATVNINNSFIQADSSGAYGIILQGPNHKLNVTNSNVSAVRYHAIRITYVNNKIEVENSTIRGYGAISMGGVNYWEANNTNLIINNSNLFGVSASDGCSYGALTDDGVNGVNIEIYNSSILTDDSENTDMYNAIRLWGNNTNLLVKNSFIESEYSYVIETSSIEDHNYTLNITHNYWGCCIPNFDNILEFDFNAFPYYKDRKMTKLSNKVKKNLVPSMELNSSIEIDIGADNEESEINISEDVNVTFDLSGMTNCSCGCKKARLRNGMCFNVKNNKLRGSVKFPENITISGNESWDGKTSIPIVKSVPKVIPSTRSGYSPKISKVIEIGNENADLVFDRGVRLLLEDYAGSKVGYIKQDNIFHEILDVCENDSQEFADSLLAGGECKVDVGDDLVIWTKHFTEFVAYEEVLVDVEVDFGSHGRGACDYDINFDWNCSDWGECVDGIQTRVCKKYNNCGNSYGKPNESRSCSRYTSSPEKITAKMFLENSKISFEDELKLRVDFDSSFLFEKNVKLIYSIFDDKNEKVYTEEDLVLIHGEESIVKSFDNLSLDKGKYKIILSFSYEGKKEGIEENFELLPVRSLVMSGNSIYENIEETGSWIVFGIAILAILSVLIVRGRRKN